MASDTWRSPRASVQQPCVRTPFLKWMLNLVALTAVLGGPRLTFAQEPSVSYSVQQCVSTPGVNRALLSACEGLRSQLQTQITAGGSVNVAPTTIDLPASGTDANGNPTGAFASSTPAATDAGATSGTNGNAAGATPGSRSGDSGAASATSGGESSSPTRSGATSSSTASTTDDGMTAGGIIGGAAGAAAASSSRASLQSSSLQSASMQAAASTQSSTMETSGTNGNGGTASSNPTGGAGSGAAAANQNGGSSDPNYYRNHVVIPAAVAGVVGGLLLIALLICCCLILRRRKKKRAAAAGAAAYHDDKEEEYNASRGGLGHSLEAGGIGAGALGAGAGAGAGAALLAKNHEKSAIPNGYGVGQTNGYPVSNGPLGSSGHSTPRTALPAVGAGAGAAALGTGHAPNTTNHQASPLLASDSTPQRPITSSNADAFSGGVAGISHQPTHGVEQSAMAAGPVAALRTGSVRDNAPERFYGPSGTGAGLSDGGRAAPTTGATERFYGSSGTGAGLKSGSGTAPMRGAGPQPVASPQTGVGPQSGPNILKATKVLGAGAGVSAAGLAGAALYRNRNKDRSNERPVNSQRLPQGGAYPEYDDDDRSYTIPAAAVSNTQAGPSNTLPPAELADNSHNGGTWLDNRSSGGMRQSGQTNFSYHTEDDGYARSDSDTMVPTNAGRPTTADREAPPPMPQHSQIFGAGAVTSTGATTSGTGIYDPFSTPPEHRSEEDLTASNEPSTVGSAGYPPTAIGGAERQVRTHSPAAAAALEPPQASGDVIPGPWRGSNSYSPHLSGEYNGAGAAAGAAPAPAIASTQARAITPAASDTINLPHDGRLRDTGSLDPRPADNRYYSESNYDDNSMLHDERPGGSSEIEDDEAFTPRQPNRQVWVYPSQQEANAFDFGGHVSPPASPTQGIPSRGLGSAVEQPDDGERLAEEPESSQAGSGSNRWSIPRKPVGR